MPNDCEIVCTSQSASPSSDGDDCYEGNETKVSADEIGSQPCKGTDEICFYFIEYHGPAALPKAIESSLNDDLRTIVDSCFSESNDLDGTSTGFQQKSISALTISGGGRLEVSDFSDDCHRLLVILIGMGKQVGELYDASCLWAYLWPNVEQDCAESE